MVISQRIDTGIGIGRDTIVIVEDMMAHQKTAQPNPNAGKNIEVPKMKKSPSAIEPGLRHHGLKRNQKLMSGILNPPKTSNMCFWKSRLGLLIRLEYRCLPSIRTSRRYLQLIMQSRSSRRFSMRTTWMGSYNPFAKQKVGPRLNETLSLIITQACFCESSQLIRMSIPHTKFPRCHPHQPRSGCHLG